MADGERDKTIVNVVAMVQTRMGSTRLPGKVMKDLGGEPMLARVISRLRRARRLTHLVIATTTEPADDVIVEFCGSKSVAVFRGSELDVLDRYYRAATEYRADVVVRITSDCPLIDPTIVDRVIEVFHDASADYVSNTMVRSYPRGLDTEVFRASALERAWRTATLSYERVHVTPYIYQHPQLFKCESVVNDIDLSSGRWTVDTPDDLALARAVYAHFYQRDDFSWLEVQAMLEQHPELVALNRNVRQKALHEG